MRLIDYLCKTDGREFIATYHEINSTEIAQWGFTLTDRWDLEDATEVDIAIAEMVTEIDSLKVGESCPFNPIRGEKRCNGFILRIK